MEQRCYVQLSKCVNLVITEEWEVVTQWHTPHGRTAAMCTNKVSLFLLMVVVRLWMIVLSSIYKLNAHKTQVDWMLLTLYFPSGCLNIIFMVDVRWRAFSMAWGEVLGTSPHLLVAMTLSILPSSTTLVSWGSPSFISFWIFRRLGESLKDAKWPLGKGGWDEKDIFLAHHRWGLACCRKDHYFCMAIMTL